MTTTNRVFKVEKIIELPFSTASDSFSAVLTDSSGNSYFDLSDIDWSRIVLEINLSTLTGTSPVIRFSAITTNRSNTPPPSAATTDLLATVADGTTAFRIASISATGNYSLATGTTKADGSAASNIGKLIGLWGDKTGGTLTSAVGTARLYIKGR